MIFYDITKPSHISAKKGLVFSDLNAWLDLTCFLLREYSIFSTRSLLAYWTSFVSETKVVLLCH